VRNTFLELEKSIEETIYSSQYRSTTNHPDLERTGTGTAKILGSCSPSLHLHAYSLTQSPLMLLTAYFSHLIFSDFELCVNYGTTWLIPK